MTPARAPAHKALTSWKGAHNFLIGKSISIPLNFEFASRVESLKEAFKQ